MLSAKRQLLLEGCEEPSAKRTCFADEVYTAFGPIPIEWFDPSLFPSTAMVTVYVPQPSVEQVVLVPASPTSLPSSSPVPFLEDVMDLLPMSPNNGSLASHEIVVVPPVPFQPVTNSTKPRVVYGKKTDVKHILSLLDVPHYQARRPFGPMMLLDSIPESMVTKRRTMKLLLTNSVSWHGVGVLTLLKDSKNLSQEVFTSNLSDISQYVRPLGFSAGELVLPSNAVCYTSYNKGNRQVTLILTDVLQYADKVKFNTAKASKRKRADVSSKKNIKNFTRFTYGMTVLKDRTTPLSVQVSFLSLLSLAFFLLRKWCRGCPAFSHLLDSTYQEASFEELSESLIQESARVLSEPFTDQEIHLLLKRANLLFKKLVQLFFELYPDV